MRDPSLCDTAPRFDGPVYDAVLDQDRLPRQLGRVLEVMHDGRCRTLEDNADAAGDPHTNITFGGDRMGRGKVAPISCGPQAEFEGPHEG